MNYCFTRLFKKGVTYSTTLYINAVEIAVCNFKFIYLVFIFVFLICLFFFIVCFNDLFFIKKNYVTKFRRSYSKQWHYFVKKTDLILNKERLAHYIPTCFLYIVKKNNFISGKSLNLANTLKKK